MQRDKILDLLSSLQAVITDSHIVYTSGKHGSAYVNKDAIYPHTAAISLLCRQIAQHFSKHKIETVIAPVVGGVILSQWVAHHLSDITGQPVLAVYAEKSEKEDRFIIKRGYDAAVSHKRVLVVEDVLNTGGSARKVVHEVRAIGGEVIGVGALCNRGKVTPESLENPPELFSLLDIDLDAWDEKNCPLCKKGIPINTQVGKGREYLASRS